MFKYIQSLHVLPAYVMRAIDMRFNEREHAYSRYYRFQLIKAGKLSMHFGGHSIAVIRTLMYFLPRGAMLLARYMLSLCVRPSVCTSVFLIFSTRKCHGHRQLYLVESQFYFRYRYWFYSFCYRSLTVNV